MYTIWLNQGKTEICAAKSLMHQMKGAELQLPNCQRKLGIYDFIAVIFIKTKYPKSTKR